MILSAKWLFCKKIKDFYNSFCKVITDGKTIKDYYNSTGDHKSNLDKELIKSLSIHGNLLIY